MSLDDLASVHSFIITIMMHETFDMPQIKIYTLRAKKLWVDLGFYIKYRQSEALLVGKKIKRLKALLVFVVALFMFAMSVRHPEC